jgi:hypothetical protein
MMSSLSLHPTLTGDFFFHFMQTLPFLIPWGKFTISGDVWHFSQPFEKGNTVGNLWAVSRGCAQEFSGPRRIQSRTDQKAHSVGSVRGIHVPTAASPLHGPSWI